MISVKNVLPAGSIGLLLAGVLTLAVLSRHPHFQAGSTEQLLHMAADGRLGAAAARVHGGLIAVMGLALYGVLELASGLGMRRPPVAFGLAAYVLGGAAMSIAMLLDGFATSQTAALLLENLPGQGAAQAALDAAASIFALVSVLVQVFTKAGFCAMGIGMGCLSLCGAGRSRAFAWAGALAGLAPAGFVVLSGVWLRQHQLMALVACQTLWYLGAAVFLATRRPAAPAALLG